MENIWIAVIGYNNELQINDVNGFLCDVKKKIQV